MNGASSAEFLLSRTLTSNEWIGFGIPDVIKEISTDVVVTRGQAPLFRQWGFEHGWVTTASVGHEGPTISDPSPYGIRLSEEELEYYQLGHN